MVGWRCMCAVEMGGRGKRKVVSFPPGLLIDFSCFFLSCFVSTTIELHFLFWFSFHKYRGGEGRNTIPDIQTCCIL